MNVKLAVLVAVVACLSLAGVCFANEDNTDFDQTDLVYNNNKVCITWGKKGGKLRVHSLYAPKKFVQLGHLRLQELTASKANVFNKNNKGKDTNKLRAVDLSGLNFDWQRPIITNDGSGRKVDSSFRLDFKGPENLANTLVSVRFRTVIAQQTSTVMVNGVSLRREVDDVQFSIEIMGWPFVSQTNLLLWSFAVRTNVARSNDPNFNNGVYFKRVKSRPGRESFIWSDSLIDMPKFATIDDKSVPVVDTTVVRLNTGGNEFNVNVYFPWAKTGILFDAIAKVVNTPPDTNPNPGPSNPPPNAPPGDTPPTNPPPVTGGSDAPPPTGGSGGTTAPSSTGAAGPTGPADYILGEPIPVDLAATTPDATGAYTPSSALFTAKGGGATALLYGNGAAMRLYGSESPNFATDNYVQLVQVQLAELAGNAEITGHTMDLTSADGVAGTWVPLSGQNNAWMFTKTAHLGCNSVTPVTFTMWVRFYADPSQLPLGPNGEAVTIGSGLGVLKITTQVERWTWVDDMSTLKYVVQVSTKDDAIAAQPNALQTPTGTRYVIGSTPYGNYDAATNVALCNGDSLWTPVTMDYALVNFAHSITHVFPYCDGVLNFDPVVSIASPNDPHYPPYVPPSEQEASLIRDPRNQFAGASTLSAPLATLFAAALVAAAAVRAF